MKDSLSFQTAVSSPSFLPASALSVSSSTTRDNRLPVCEHPNHLSCTVGGLLGHFNHIDILLKYF